MTFLPATDEKRFVLAQTAPAAAMDQDVIDAVLEGVARLATSVWSPLSRAGDMTGAVHKDDGVTMPPGFAAAYREYVAGGWATIGVPEEHGGQGLPFVLQAAVLETLGSANMALALCPLLTTGAVEALRHHGSPAQQETYLPKLATGEWTGTMNLTEPQAGSDVGALRTVATARDDGGWNIKGTKIFISYGDHDLADNIVHLVLARTPGAPAGTRGISLFLVPKVRSDGIRNDIRVVSIEHKLGLHASPTCVLSFGDADDCVGELIGEELGGMRAMFTMMNNARLNVGVQGVQVAEAAMQKAVAYARERVQGTRDGRAAAIIDHPDVRRMLLRMKAQTAAARALVYHTCAYVDLAAVGDDGTRDRLEVLTPLAKAHATDLGNEVASLGLQVHGGMGYIEEAGAAQFVRDARITPIYEGTNGIQAADLVGRKLALSGGAAFSNLMAECREESEAPPLRSLIDTVARIGQRLRTMDADDRLAASSPFLTMAAVAMCGWLLEKQARATTDDGFGRGKRAVVRFYLEQIVPEAQGLAAAAGADAGALRSLSEDALAIG